MSAPRVAILIPSYNSAGTIAQTLDSVQRQLPEGASDIGVYLADDASKDDTIAVAQRIWKAHVPLQVIARERNLGQWPNKNGALAEIARSADWVLLLHSDDFARNEWISVLLDRISRCPASVGSICSGWKNLYLEDPAPNPEDDAPPKIEEIAGTPESIRWTLLKGCWWLISGCAIRLAAFHDVGLFDPQFPYGGDYDWLLRCLHKGWDVEFVEKNLTFRRHHSASVAGQSSLRHLDIRDYIRIYNRYASVLAPREIVRLHAKACIALVRRMARSVLSRNPQRFLGAVTTLFWVLGEFSLAAAWPRILRVGSGPLTRPQPR
jgi:glycosyltransferase involved in cell wall biosynthesis